MVTSILETAQKRMRSLKNLTEPSATESNDKELRLRWLKTSSAAYTFSATLACSVYSFTTATNRLIGSSGVRMTTCESERMKRLGVQGRSLNQTTKL